MEKYIDFCAESKKQRPCRHARATSHQFYYYSRSPREFCPRAIRPLSVKELSGVYLNQNLLARKRTPSARQTRLERLVSAKPKAPLF